MTLPNHSRIPASYHHLIAALFVTAMTLSATSCGDLRTAPHPFRTLSLRERDGQRGVARHHLDQTLAVQVLDPDGAPLPNVTVRWTTDDGGEFTPSESISDDGGFARTEWTLGPSAGAQHARAVIDGAASVDFAASAAADPTAGATPTLSIARRSPTILRST